MNKKNTGFTLIEVLVALTIFTIASVAASSAAMSYTRSTEHLRTKTYAYFLAKNRMADMLINQEITKNNTTFTKKITAQDIKWSVVSKVSDAEKESLKKITVTVYTEEPKKAITDLIFYSYIQDTKEDKNKGYVFQ